MGQVHTIQILRALAALMVVIGHAQDDAKVASLKLGTMFERNHILPWNAGVDLFFVISGFIIVHTSEHLFESPQGRRLFLWRRLVRIVPLYWVFSLLMLAMMAAAPSRGGLPLPAWPDILASFAFWPADTFGDGYPRPFFSLGWTLNYEMFFYFVFAVFIFFPQGRAVAAVVGLFSALIVLGPVFPVQFAALSVWSKPIILEFVLGMCLALFFGRGLCVGRAVRIALGGSALLVLCADPLHSSDQGLDWINTNGWARFFFWGLPASFLVAASLFGGASSGEPETTAGRGAPTAFLSWSLIYSQPLMKTAAALRYGSIALGNASYALYLVHPFMVVALRKFWIAAGLHLSLGFWPLVVFSAACACCAAGFIHYRIELPVLQFMRRYEPSLGRKQPVQARIHMHKTPV
jgi:peptidoglycan/LPS O-acetylase OafA/YrhL